MSANTAAMAAHDPGQRARDADAAVLNDPRFHELVRSRDSLAWTLSAVMLAVYLGFIFLVAFGKSLLATKIGGGTTSLGIVLGLVVIVLAFVLTAVYVARANGRFDDLTQELVRGTRP